MGYFNKIAQEVKDEAIADGHSIIDSEPDVLLLDYDDPPEGLYQQRLILLQNIFPFTTVERLYVSRSGKGFHAVIRLGCNLPVLARIALQAAMGSNPLREILAVSENISGNETPPFLICPKMETAIKNIRDKACPKEFPIGEWTRSSSITWDISTTDTTNIAYIGSMSTTSGTGK